MQSSSTSLMPLPVRIWLLTGVAMVFLQIVIGGVTRLTDSGLSITEWAIIQGTIPPLNEVEWQEVFEKYKSAAKKQYQSLHADMTMTEFKGIYFWEYAHRLWARLMGFVFLLPFLYFLWKKWLPTWLLRRLAVVIGLAALAAVFGWIMVASGLYNDKRTWVSAYKLIIHLAIATTLFGYLFWTWLQASQPSTYDIQFLYLKRLSWLITTVLFIQIVFGGLMAGTKAALIHPHFPVFIEGEHLIGAFTAAPDTRLKEEVMDYERFSTVKATVQILHRFTAWLLSGLIVFFFFSVKKRNVSFQLRVGSKLLIRMLVVQFLLGVFTVINSVGKIPVFFGAAHQAGALVLLATVLFVNYQFCVKKRIVEN